MCDTIVEDKVGIYQVRYRTLPKIYLFHIAGASIRFVSVLVSGRNVKYIIEKIKMVSISDRKS